MPKSCQEVGCMRFVKALSIGLCPFQSLVDSFNADKKNLKIENIDIVMSPPNADDDVFRLRLDSPVPT